VHVPSASGASDPKKGRKENDGKFYGHLNSPAIFFLLRIFFSVQLLLTFFRSVVDDVLGIKFDINI
jgi:hypothetical protein